MSRPESALRSCEGTAELPTHRRQPDRIGIYNPLISRALLLACLCACTLREGLNAQNTLYSIQPVTTDQNNHLYPSLNDDNDVVWSQKDANGYYQVYLNSSPITSGNNNHTFAVIDNNKNMLYLKDGVGAGAGLAVILNQGGVESTVEFSSGSPPGCTLPPSCATCCTSWRTAGSHFGIVKTAPTPTTVTYYDFCNQGDCTRTVDITGQPSFGGFIDYPDLNAQSVLSFIGTPLTTTPTAFPASGTNTVFSLVPNTGGRLNNNNELVYVRAGGAVTSTSLGTVDTGTWADVNSNGNIVYTKVVANISQVFMAIRELAPACDDVRDQIIGQYAPGAVYANGVYDIRTMQEFKPVCSYFTHTQGSVNFTFADLNQSNKEPPGFTTRYPWALIRRPLVIGASSSHGLDDWNQECIALLPTSDGSRVLTSAYRNPSDNKRQGGSSPTSRHMFGDAADFANNTCPSGSTCYAAKTPKACGAGYAEWNGMRIAATMAGATSVEPLAKSTCSHVHAEFTNSDSVLDYVP